MAISGHDIIHVFHSILFGGTIKLGTKGLEKRHPV